MRKGMILLVLLLAILVLTALPAQAQDTAELPVVYAVFFYLDTCPHCHDVINNVFPLMDDEFGEQLQIIGLEASTEMGGYYFFQACDFYGIPENSCGSVPLLVIGETEWMLGAVEIPNRAFDLVRDGLAAGGIPLPEFIRADFEAAQAAEAAQETAGETTDAGASVPAATADESAPALADATEIDASTSVADRLAADPAANAVAIAVLVVLVLSAFGVIVLGRSGQLAASKLPGIVALVAVVGGIVMGLSLLSNTGGDTLVLVSVLVVLVTLSFATLFLVAPTEPRDLRRYALPLVLVAGLVVAIYLAQVETGDSAAVCGAIGDCNTVQQSEYASLFGVLPVGVLGIIGYVAMLAAWGVTLLNGGKSAYAPLAKAILFWMALAGVGFSIYLTFLEPFVIGATCAWCITSALTMLAALWLSAPQGWQAATQVIIDESDSAAPASPA